MPVSLISHFVTTKLKQVDKEKAITQDTLINKVLRNGRVVVLATAGFGKSMLMKYIALSMYENPRGRIPIFIELRHLNRVTNPDIITFIHSTYKKNSVVGVEAFRLGLEIGAFCLILDGFDEINHDLRQIIEGQILSISNTYKNISIIVSGRPDDKFLSWRTFEVWKICPMAKSQVTELINKLDYDGGTKKRFIIKVNNGLYDSHQSFLSTPLLAILMLLTFEENANIPDKMHLFYSKAFETLFHKHDAMKEQYDRQRKSGLQIDDFEKVFSVFCLSSYVKEKLEFTRSEILSLLKSAITYTGISVDPSNLLFDLEEAVCLLQFEGLSYFFVHRSFQEYFTALFLSTCPEDVRDGFIDEVVVRHWDNVLPMLFDMASDQLEPSWVLRQTDKYLAHIKSEKSTDFIKVLSKWRGVSFYKQGNSHDIFNLIPGDYAKYLSVMHRFYPLEFGSKTRIDFSMLIPLAQPESDASLTPVEIGEESFMVRNLTLCEEHLKELGSANIIAFCNEEYQVILRIRRGINTQQSARSKFLNDLFSKP